MKRYIITYHGTRKSDNATCENALVIDDFGVYDIQKRRVTRNLAKMAELHAKLNGLQFLSMVDIEVQDIK